jgi:ADP-heptose:LPS heptosyltransferase
MKILFIRSGGLGDSILTLAAINSIKKLYPGSELWVLGNGHMLEVAELSGLFETNSHIETGGFHCLFGESDPVQSVRDFFCCFDTVFAYSSAGENLRKKILDCGVADCRIIDPNPPGGYRAHIVNHLYSIAGTELSEKPSLPAIRGISGITKKFDIAIHPGSGGTKKNWPPENFMEIISSYTNPVVILGPAEIEHEFESVFASYRTEKPSTIKKLCEILSRSKMYLGNDSGVSHCAAWCGVPSLVLFGNTDPRIWRPVGESVHILKSADGEMENIVVSEVKAVMDTIGV